MLPLLKKLRFVNFLIHDWTLLCPNSSQSAPSQHDLSPPSILYFLASWQFQAWHIRWKKSNLGTAGLVTDSCNIYVYYKIYIYILYIQKNYIYCSGACVPWWEKHRTMHSVGNSGCIFYWVLNHKWVDCCYLHPFWIPQSTIVAPNCEPEK